MNILVALGLELGSFNEFDRVKYLILVSNKEMEITELQYKVYTKAQKARKTVSDVANDLELEYTSVARAVDQLVAMGAAMYWTNTLDYRFFDTHYLTPRGNSCGKYCLKSVTFSTPVNLESFGYYLWIYSHPSLSISEVIDVLCDKFGYVRNNAIVDLLLNLPILLGEGLVTIDHAIN